MLSTDNCEDAKGTEESHITLIAKFGKERISLDNLTPDTTIGSVKQALQERTRVLPKRQKLVGLSAQPGHKLGDETPLSLLKKSKASKGNVYSFILMGTPEEDIFVDPHERDDLPDVVDDFDLDFNAGSVEWLRHVANGENLKNFTRETQIHWMNPSRPGKPLLVLDLDHTLLDFSSKSLLRRSPPSQSSRQTNIVQAMKRPHMDSFLTQTYQHYDLVVWSQTSWRWLETKLIELGMLTASGYKFCFVLDKTSMFTVTTEDKRKHERTHHVKPLQLIWTKVPQWTAKNTVHLDDLSRNFALNMKNGIKCSGFYRKKNPQDQELRGIGQYLVQLAQSGLDFERVDFQKWKQVIDGSSQLAEEDESD